MDHVGAVNEFDHIYLHPSDRSLIPDYKGHVIEIREGYRFDLGELTVEVLEFPAHTEGSVGFLDSKKRFFTGDAIGAKRCIMHLTKLPLEAMLAVLGRIESIQNQWEGIWNGHFGQMNRVLRIDHVRKLKELVQSIVEGDGKFTGQADPAGQQFWKINFIPWTATDGELLLIYNPHQLKR
jgi:glyoxylase-like metal-dependent hydrolase (beta-lactamase superfamily II)